VPRSGVTRSWCLPLDLWDREALDLVGPAFIEFRRDLTGSFRFVAVEGWMDCREAPHNESPSVEFTWEESADDDRACGRGWAALEEDGSLIGHIYFHLGDDSGFRAIKEPRPERGR
jgi:hypothetical protein